MAAETIKMFFFLQFTVCMFTLSTRDTNDNEPVIYHTWCRVLYWTEPCNRSRTTSERDRTFFTCSTHAYNAFQV